MIKKVLDTLINMRYNKFIKSNEWFIDHSHNKDLDYGCS